MVGIPVHHACMELRSHVADSFKISLTAGMVIKLLLSTLLTRNNVIPSAETVMERHHYTMLVGEFSSELILGEWMYWY